MESIRKPSVVFVHRPGLGTRLQYIDCITMLHLWKFITGTTDVICSKVCENFGTLVLSTRTSAKIPGLSQPFRDTWQLWQYSVGNVLWYLCMHVDSPWYDILSVGCFFSSCNNRTARYWEVPAGILQMYMYINFIRDTEEELGTNSSI